MDMRARLAQAWSFGRLAGLVLLAALTCGALVSCAGVQGVPHSLTFRNLGTQPVQGVELVYGAEVIPYAGVFRPGGAATHAGVFAVPQSLTVRWRTLDGKAAQQTAPVRLKGIVRRQLNNLEIQLTDGGLVLFQGVAVDKAMREQTRIHP